MLSDDLKALAEEVSGIASIVRAGNRRELRAALAHIRRDLEDAARKVTTIESNPDLDTAWMTHYQMMCDRQATASVQGIAARTFGEGFDPEGFYVYLLWGTEPDKPLYVGLSTNILSRLGAHLTNPERRDHIIRVGLIQCDDEHAMRETERRLIAGYKPPWNIALVHDWYQNTDLAMLDDIDTETLDARYG